MTMTMTMTMTSSHQSHNALAAARGMLKLVRAYVAPTEPIFSVQQTEAGIEWHMVGDPSLRYVRGYVSFIDQKGYRPNADSLAQDIERALLP